MLRHPWSSSAAVVALVLVALAFGGGAAAATPDLGPNVIVFDPSMPTSQIRATVDAIAAQQVPTACAQSANRPASGRSRR